MAGQDPGSIQREIEHTRAELAETIDAIADRVSPRRMATRGAARVKGVFAREQAPDGFAREPAEQPGIPVSELREIAAEGAGAGHTGTSTYAIERSLRTDRVLIAVGVVAGVAALVILARKRAKNSV